MHKICLSFFLVVSLVSNAQTYSLQECIRMAIENNNDIKIQSLNNQSTELQYKQAKNNLLPSVNLGSGVNYNIGYSISPLDYSYSTKNSFSGNLSLSSQVTLFQGFQQLKNIQKAEIDHNTVNYQIQSIENTVRIQVINYYLQALLEYKSLDILNQQVEVSKSLLQKKQEATENGLISKNALREHEIQLSIDEANKLKQLFQVESALNRLKIYMQFPQFKKFSIDTNIRLEPTNNQRKTQMDTSSIHSMPDVQLEQMRLLSLNKQIEINKGALFPTITLGYSLASNFINTAKTYDYKSITNPIIGFVNDTQQTYVRSFSSQSYAIAEHNIPIISQISNNKQHQFQLNFQWQLFGKGNKRTNIKLAEIASKQQEYRIKLTEQKIKENYYQAFINVQSSWIRYQMNQTIVDAQKERYQIALERLENNLTDYFEFITYQNQFQNAALDVAKSKIEWYFNQEILNLYK